MTLQRVLDLADEMKPNMVSLETRIQFINEIEGKIHGEILMKHVHEAEDEECPTYSADTDANEELEDGDEELLVPAPYDMVYVYWLLSRIDEINQEMDKYNNDRAMFENAWTEFGDYWRRGHMPITPYPQFYF